MIVNWRGIRINGKLESIRYDQMKNAIEAIIRKRLNEAFSYIKNIPNINAEIKDDIIDKITRILHNYLESCGMSAFMCLMEGMGFLTENNYPKLNGKMIQMDDWGMCEINDPKNNYSRNQNEMDNRAVYNYVKLAWKLFKCKAIVFRNLSFDDVKEHIKHKRGVQLLVPGHYIAAGNQDKKGIYFMDSWAGRSGLKNHGDNECMSESQFNVQAQNHFIVYYPKK